MRALSVIVWTSAQSAKGTGENGATEERSDGASASSHVPACLLLLMLDATPSRPAASTMVKAPFIVGPVVYVGATYGAIRPLLGR
uniref:Uncharacterized protein n=1 Tax=Triticum urartu TaxID=4572 RepID=A0A8R7RF90_TRIUA|eukprot:UN15799